MNTLVPTAARFSAAGPERAAAVQGQRDAQAGEDQGGGVRDRRFQGGNGGQVAGGVDHAVLGGEADRGGGRGQDAEPGGGVAQPQTGPVLESSGSWCWLTAVAGQADQRHADRAEEEQARAGCRRAAGHVLAGSGVGEGDERKREGHGRSLSARKGHGAVPGGLAAAWSAPVVRTPTPSSRRVTCSVRDRGARVRFLARSSLRIPATRRARMRIAAAERKPATAVSVIASVMASRACRMMFFRS